MINPHGTTHQNKENNLKICKHCLARYYKKHTCKEKTEYQKSVAVYADKPGNHPTDPGAEKLGT